MADGDESGRRRRSAALLAVTAIVALVIGMVATMFVKSPERVAAETAPPPRTVVKVSLEKRVITQSVVVNGIVLPENSTVIRLATAAGTAQDVVGDLPAPKGARVGPGDRIATVSGRPILALPGRVPAYRTLKPGMTGDDVTQLQEGLRAAGHMVDDPAGTYGPRTRGAVVALYAKAGFTAIEEGGDTAVGAEAAVDQLRRQRDDSRLALTRLQRDQRAAQQEVANAPKPPPAPGQPAPTNQKAPAASAQSADAIADAKRSLARIEEDLEKAVTRLAEARDKQGATVPLGEIVFVPELPAIVSELRSAVGQPASASQLTLASGPLAVRAQLTADQATQVRADQRAAVIGSDASQFRAVTGPVIPVAAPADGADLGSSQTGQNGGTGTTYRVTLRPETPLPPETENQPSRVSIAVASTPTEVLAAPAATVSTAADGTAQVVVAGSPTRAVPVGVGFVGEGFVEVTPRAGASLNAGDQLLIGWTSDAAPAPTPS